MARPTVRILNRYLLRQHFAPLGFALAALTAILILQQVAKQFGNLVGKGLPWGVIFQAFVLSIPFIIAMTLPMAVLVAVLYANSRLAADNEITAMKAGGISLGRILWPVVRGATLLALFAFLWNDQLLPRANHRLRTLLVDIQRKKPSFSLKEHVINEVLPGQFFLRATRISQATSKLKDVTIYDLGDADRRRIIAADSGHMAYTPGGTDLYLTLLDGDVEDVKRADPTQFNRTFFRINRIRVAGIGNVFETTDNDTFRGDREMTICEMQKMVAAARDEEVKAHRDVRDAVAGDLRRLAGLAPLPPAAAVTDTAAGLMCRFWAGMTGWLTPREAAAQTPAHVPPPAQTPAVRPAVPQPIPAPHLSFSSTVGEAERVRGARIRAAQYEVEIQKKFAISAACVVFALLGLPLALRFPRGGAGLVIGTSVVVFAIYYIGLIGGEDLGDRLIVGPFLAMWTPNLIFGVVGLLGLWAVRRESGTSRGGDWSDVKEAAFGWLRRWRGETAAA